MLLVALYFIQSLKSAMSEHVSTELSGSKYIPVLKNANGKLRLQDSRAMYDVLYLLSKDGY